jgi:hypothetical protein
MKMLRKCVSVGKLFIICYCSGGNCISVCQAADMVNIHYFCTENLCKNVTVHHVMIER